MLARMNFASQLATNQKFNLRDIASAAPGNRRMRSLALMLDRLTAPAFSREAHAALLDYARARRRLDRLGHAAGRPRRPASRT